MDFEHPLASGPELFEEAMVPTGKRCPLSRGLAVFGANFALCCSPDDCYDQLAA